MGYLELNMNFEENRNNNVIRCVERYDFMDPRGQEWSGLGLELREASVFAIERDIQFRRDLRTSKFKIHKSFRVFP